MAEETKEFAEVKVTDQSVMQALLEADFMILGTKLVAEYYKNGEQNYFLLMPTDEADARSITVEEMLNDIKILVGDTLDTTELINCMNSIGINVDKIKVSLQMAYFYMISDGKDKNNNNTEYAFHLEIDTSEGLPASFKLFDINKIGFAIWNTERPKIISQMNLYKPEDLLA